MQANDIAHEIVPRLWLGNKTAAASGEWLENHGITVVFNCTKDLPFHTMIRRQYRVPVHDNLQKEEIDNLYKWAPETMVKLIQEYKRGETILVHCHAGMQRSAAVVAMFLMSLYGMSKDQAMQHIRSKRSVAFFPSANFEPAIDQWEKSLQNIKPK
jgi:protein-tyrosine phosphatase